MTVVREVEWDDYEREKMLALELYESEICECGYHKSLAHDPDQWFDLVAARCPLCADIAARERAQAKADEAEAESLKDDPGRRRKSDGRRWFVKWMTKAEHDRRVAAATAPTPGPRSAGSTPRPRSARPPR